MNKAVTSALLWMVAVCLLIALIMPSTPIGQHAIKALVVGIVMLAVLGVFELIFIFTKTTSSLTWKSGDPDQVDDNGCVDDLVDGTAMGLIDWTGEED